MTGPIFNLDLITRQFGHRFIKTVSKFYRAVHQHQLQQKIKRVKFKKKNYCPYISAILLFTWFNQF